MKLSCSSGIKIRLTRIRGGIFFGTCFLVLLAIADAHAGEINEDKITLIDFELNPGDLKEVLLQFCSQASLQCIYPKNTMFEEHSAGLSGRMSVAGALASLLQESGLSSKFISSDSVAIFPLDQFSNSIELLNRPAPQDELPTDGITILSDIDVSAEQPWWSNSNSDSAFGVAKPLLETPRSVSFVSGDAIDQFSLSAVEDLLRVAPGVFTTTRFGIQGAVDIRNIPADTYFQGMKRLTLQGHGRSVLAAMDSIEVVGGPVSPLIGIGKMGGYVNMVPKSGRSHTGKYLEEIQGFSQFITGDYHKNEFSMGFGGPVSLGADKQGGYYLYGLNEDSDSYTAGVPIKQIVLQLATSIDNLVGPFRLEAGVNYQESRTSGALTGRFTQDLVDHGKYIGGEPLVNLDLNGNGKIGFLEMNQASPVNGQLARYNQALHQGFAWPKDSQGNYLNAENFPVISGIPEAMFNYLLEHPESDPTGLLVAARAGGPLPESGSVPIGMVLDPSTIQFNNFNPRRSAAFEQDLRAEFFTTFIDLVYDQNPDFTVKNQIFFDVMNQYKSSNQPFSQVQDVHVFEDKFTLTNRLANLPNWLQINGAFSFNIRNTISEGKTTYGDYGNHRTDATSSGWNLETAGMTDNTTFTSSNDNTDLYDDGLPWGVIYRTEFSEIGVGFLFDIDVLNDTNILVGARYDNSLAENINYAGRYQYNAGTADNPGRYLQHDDVAKARDSGTTWSVSVSQQLPLGLHPYLTFSQAAILLDGNNNSLTNTVINAGHIGSAQLKEVGLKASWWRGKLEFSTALYEQGRTGVSIDDDPALINAYATSTTTKGWQTELKWAPKSGLYFSLYALNQVTRYTPNIGGYLQVDASFLGFQDVVDSDGNIVYPAEAFLYGGRARINLPSGLDQYERKQGNPETQMGLSTVYQFSDNWSAVIRGNYLSSTCTGRLCIVELPSSRVLDAGLIWSNRALEVKLDVFNITDEKYFRARTGETLGDVIAQAMPNRHAQLSLKFNF